MKSLRYVALAVCLSVASVGAHAQQFINILTGGTSGVYYPMGVALSQIYEKTIPNAKIAVQSTKASAENVNLIQAGRGELAFALADTVSAAWQGNVEVGFKTKLDKLRGIAGIYSNYIQIVASADSGIKTLADLKGKRVSVGAARSGTELNARAVLKAAGLTYADLAKVEYMGFGESVELMKNRQLDATLQSAGLGVASIRDLANSVPIVLIPVPDSVVAKINDPAYIAGVIPAGTYEGQTQAIPTATIPNVLVTNMNVTDEVAYEMTKSLFTNLPQLVAAHSAAKGIVPANGPKTPVPLHPGAIKYYKEAGLLK